MNYYCEICDKTMEHKSKNVHLKSFTHIEYEKSLQLTYTIINPDFFDIEKVFDGYITNHNEKIHFYFVKCDFKLDLNKFTPHIKTKSYHNNSIVNLKRNLLHWIDYFIVMVLYILILTK